MKKYIVAIGIVLTFVAVVSLSVVGIRKSWAAAAANDVKVCGTVVGQQGQVAEGRWQVTIDDDGHAILVPTRQAYDRLKLGKEFTFYFRKGELVAIDDGDLCHK